jgi:hypothetical protein
MISVVGTANVRRLWYWFQYWFARFCRLLSPKTGEGQGRFLEERRGP